LPAALPACCVFHRPHETGVLDGPPGAACLEDRHPIRQGQVQNRHPRLEQRVVRVRDSFCSRFQTRRKPSSTCVGTMPPLSLLSNTAKPYGIGNRDRAVRVICPADPRLLRRGKHKDASPTRPYPVSGIPAKSRRGHSIYLVRSSSKQASPQSGKFSPQSAVLALGVGLHDLESVLLLAAFCSPSPMVTVRHWPKLINLNAGSQEEPRKRK